MQIQQLDQQMTQIKTDYPEWEYKPEIKTQIHQLEVQKLLLQQKLAYQQHWITDKEGYEQQLETMTEKWNNSQIKLEKVRDLVANGELEKLKGLIRRGEI